MTYLKQIDQALFPDLIWAEPQIQLDKPKVLIMGGYANGLKMPLQAFQILKTGNFNIKIALPSSLKSLLKIKVNKNESDVLFFPSTEVGSFSLKAQDDLLNLINTQDALWIAGDTSHNQQTQQLIQNLITQSKIHKFLNSSVLPLILDKNLNQISNLNLMLLPNDLIHLNKIFKTANSYNQKWNLDQFGQFLSELPINFHIISLWNRHLWVKKEQKVCATTINPKILVKDSENDLLKITKFFIAETFIKSQTPWQNLVNASWKSLNSQ
ncbi:MAG: hypothetical protein OXF85_02320 [Candidatus Saccharibacteria bacterium]|nr:hypothetical protein [Candidatus Saccharibacteria bacterium]